MNVQTIANANLLNIINLLFEFELMPKWIPFMDKGEKISKVTERRVLARVSISLPWPLTDRELFVEGNFFYLKKERAFVLSISSPKRDKWFGYDIKKDP